MPNGSQRIDNSLRIDVNLACRDIVAALPFLIELITINNSARRSRPYITRN